MLNGLERKGRGRSGQEQKRRVRPKVGPYRGQNNIATTRGRVGGVAVAQTETRNLPHPSSPAPYRYYMIIVYYYITLSYHYFIITTACYCPRAVSPAAYLQVYPCTAPSTGGEVACAQTEMRHQ